MARRSNRTRAQTRFIEEEWMTPRGDISHRGWSQREEQEDVPMPVLELASPSMAKPEEPVETRGRSSTRGLPVARRGRRNGRSASLGRARATSTVPIVGSKRKREEIEELENENEFEAVLEKRIYVVEGTVEYLLKKGSPLENVWVNGKDVAGHPKIIEFENSQNITNGLNQDTADAPSRRNEEEGTRKVGGFYRSCGDFVHSVAATAVGVLVVGVLFAVGFFMYQELRETAIWDWDNVHPWT